MVMCEENCSNLPDVDTCFRKTACYSVTRVYKIQRAVDNQQIGRVCLARSREWSTERPQRDETGAGLRRCLRPSDLRNRRQRGRARHEMQKLSTGKFYHVS